MAAIQLNNSPHKRYAAIDLGTNTIILIIIENTGDKLIAIHEEHLIIKLGEGLAFKGNISKNAMKRCLKAFEYFAQIIQFFNVEKTFCVATQAMRIAENGRQIISTVNKLGFHIKIISREEEGLN